MNRFTGNFGPVATVGSTDCVSITILNGALVEEAESFYLSLERLSPVMRVALNSAIFVVEDDDCKWIQLSTSLLNLLH